MAVSPRGSAGSAKKTTKEIREWAIGEGLEVSSRGRISVEIEQAFHDAQAKRAQAEPEPVKKKSSKKAIAETTAVKKKTVKKVLGEKAPAKGASASEAPAQRTTKEIREWAIEEGLEVSSRGRIPAEIEQAFDDAQAKKAQVKPAPVKKKAAKKPAAKKTATAAPIKTTAASTAPAGKKMGTAKAAAEKPTGKAAVKKQVAAKVPVKKAVESKAPAKSTNKEIRAWAIADGREVSYRGRIPAEVEQAFHDAQAKKAQVKPAPVKKTAAKKTAAKNTTAAAPVKRVAASKAPAKKSSREIREWAIGAGHEVSARGRISVEIERAFHDAQAATPVARAATLP
jgi:hypothetical protein